MTGIASKKENLVASCLDNPKKSPAVIVTPDLDVPGISANTWDRPIKKPIPRLTAVSSVFFFLKSAKYNNNPKKIVAIAITIEDLKFCSIDSLNNHPSRTTGTVATVMMPNRE